MVRFSLWSAQTDSVPAFLNETVRIVFHFAFQRFGATFYCSWVPRFSKTQTLDWAENAQSKRNLSDRLVLAFFVES